MAKGLKKQGHELDLVRRALLTMRRRGVKVKTPYAVRWQSPERGTTWYDYSTPQLPPLWDRVSREVYSEGAIPTRV